MRLAHAIRASKPWRGYRSVVDSRAQYISPPMFKANLLFAYPDFINGCVFSQIIDMPVGMMGNFKVMVDPGGQTAGAKGAADIGVIPLLEFKGSEFSDPDFFSHR